MMFCDHAMLAKRHQDQHLGETTNYDYDNNLLCPKIKHRL